MDSSGWRLPSPVVSALFRDRDKVKTEVMRVDAHASNAEKVSRVRFVYICVLVEPRCYICVPEIYQHLSRALGQY